MLAAMMGVAPRAANRHDLLAGDLTIPSGVSTIKIYASDLGGDAGTGSTPFGQGGGGGGGAGLIWGCDLAVTAGDVISQVAFTIDVFNEGGIEIRKNGVEVGRAQRGRNPDTANDPRGGRGGFAQWTVTSASASGGAVVATAGDAGLDGDTVVTANGILFGGGSGGAGNTITPPSAGGAGGNASNFAGSPASGFWGGGGGGLNPGSTRFGVGGLDKTSRGTAFCYAEW